MTTTSFLHDDDDFSSISSGMVNKANESNAGKHEKFSFLVKGLNETWLIPHVTHITFLDSASILFIILKCFFLALLRESGNDFGSSMWISYDYDSNETKFFLQECI